MKGTRPLYRLPELLAKPSAPVLVVEGERAADAAVRLLPSHAVTTSSCGAHASKGSDWSPLGGRDVVVWPDADEDGARYAADVSRFAREAGAASVRIVELPDGLPEGWDLADALPDGWTADTLRDLVDGAPEAGETVPVASTGRRARLICLADVKPEPIEWLWSPRLARGKLTLLAGDPGAGKTWLALAIAAALSRGSALPGESDGRAPSSVVYLTREDGIADTLRPRLDALGADVARVHALEGADDGAAVTLADVDVIGDAVARTAAALVVVDPLQSWLGAGIDANRANETRPVLDALGAMCARHGCACLLIAHTAKARGTRAVTAALGSIDFAGASRVMLVAGTDPTDPSRRVVAGAKCNIGPMPGSLAYIVDPAAGTFAWCGAVDVSAGDVLAADSGPSEKGTALADAVAWLRGELVNGPRPVREIEGAAEAAGITKATLRRAKDAGGFTAARDGFGRGGAWVWSIGAHPSAIDAQTASLSTYDAYVSTYGAGDVERGVI